MAAVEDEGGLVAVHRTRLDAKADEGRSAFKAALGPLGKGAVRLAPPGAHLGLAEGIENALAVTALTGVPCWATLGAARMGRIALPADVTRLTLYLDADAGGRQAERLARDAFGASLSLDARYPRRAGSDWNEVLLAQCAGVRFERKGCG